jgi:hypothetical protein
VADGTGVSNRSSAWADKLIKRRPRMRYALELLLEPKIVWVALWKDP